MVYFLQEWFYILLETLLFISFTGMVTASFAILFMKIKLEWHSIIFCSTGAFFGLIFGKKFY
jgi:hypothetical protein